MQNVTTVQPPKEDQHPVQPQSRHTHDQIDVRSEEVQEIIGRPPHGLVRWGITAFFGVLILVLLSSWFIRYPEVIDAPLRLTAIHAPKTLEARVNGKLVRLPAENNSEVQQGQVLGWIESTANHATVLELSELIDEMRSWLIDGQLHQFHSVELAGFINMGPLQTGFQGFEQSFRELLSFLDGGFYVQQRHVLQQELEYTRLLLEKLIEQREIQQAEYELSEREYGMMKRLAERELVAPIEVDREESNMISRRLPLQQTEASIINNYVSQASKEQEILELERRIAEQQSIFLQAINSLKSTIDDWKSNYLITAPFDGRLIYTGILQENQSLSAGQEIFYVQPENSDFFGELTISQNAFGKIEEGQAVLVRFNSYPHHEYGTVDGRLSYVSNIPVRDSVFVGKVEFPDGLVTNYGRQLTPRNGMTGQAEIITQDMRLMERIINNMVKELH